ncbi:hypothetical protein Bca101_032657 [Brassica carinata]
MTGMSLLLLFIDVLLPRNFFLTFYSHYFLTRSNYFFMQTHVRVPGQIAVYRNDSLQQTDSRRNDSLLAVHLKHKTPEQATTGNQPQAANHTTINSIDEFNPQTKTIQENTGNQPKAADHTTINAINELSPQTKTIQVHIVLLMLPTP